MITGAAPGFTENDWADRDLRIGADLTIRVIARSPRCAIPTLEHGGLPRDTDALRVPAKHNRVSPMDDLGSQPCADVYAQVLRGGRAQAGDVMRLVLSRTTRLTRGGSRPFPQPECLPERDLRPLTPSRLSL